MNWIAKLRWLGVGLLLASFLLLNPGPPYQDPTPELEAKYRAQTTRFEYVAATGLALLAVGLIARCFVKPMPRGKPTWLDRVYQRYVAE